MLACSTVVEQPFLKDGSSVRLLKISFFRKLMLCHWVSIPNTVHDKHSESHIRYRSFATRVSQLKIYDFSGEAFKGSQVNFLWVQRRHNCCPVASFANCVMTLYLLKVHLQTFLSVPITQKCQIFSCDTLVANEWCLLRATCSMTQCHIPEDWNLYVNSSVWS